ncbi:unnamed protein product, partial [Symbiodinium sp. CCMP2456]
FKVELEENGYRISLEASDAPSGFYHYGKKTSVDGPTEGNYNFDRLIPYGEYANQVPGRFRLVMNPGSERQGESDYHFVFRTYIDIAKSLAKNISISQESDKGSLIVLSAEGPIQEKLEDFLNTTIRELQQYELERKNQMSVNTIKFIDEQLGYIVDTLTSAEDELEEFRSNNQVVDLTSEAQEVYTQYVELEKQKAELQLQGEYFRYLQDYINNQDNYGNLMIPSVAGVDDPVLLGLIEKIIQLSAEQSKLQYSLEPNNPALLQLDDQIDKVNQQIDRITSRYANLPQTEQKLINLRRKYEMSNQQYIYLMQKRAEAGIMKAANTPDTQVIDPAFYHGQAPIAPNPMRNYAIALMLGLILPVGFVFLSDQFDTKVRDYSDVEKQVRIPILGG